MQELKDKFVGRFIGPDKIADIEVLELTTPSGGMVFLVSFEDGAKAKYTEKGIAVLSSAEPTDYTAMRDARVNALVPAIVDLIREYDLPSEQWIYLLGQVGDQMRNRIYRAQSFLIHGDDSRYIPGSDPENEMTLLDADNIISRIPKKEDA